MKIYGAKVSGNCLKIKYVCDYLGIPYDWREIHLSKDKSKTETQAEAQNKVEMLEVNPQVKFQLLYSMMDEVYRNQMRSCYILLITANLFLRIYISKQK